MYWDRLTSEQITELDRDIPVVLPVAATEQHGPHLPVATDRLIGEHLLARVDAAMTEDVLILPTLAVGCSLHHMDFDGTLSLSHDTFAVYVEEVLGACAAQGFRNLVIANSHGGNRAIGGVIVERLGDTYDEHRVAMLTWWTAAADALLPLNETGPGGVGHACEFETSLMLLIAPELVRTDRLPAPANQPTFPWATGDMLRGARATLYSTMQDLTPTGAWGDPRSATAAKGEAITAAVVAAYTEILSDLRHADS